jgi:phosphatidate cytidylyltransferase
VAPPPDGPASSASSSRPPVSKRRGFLVRIVAAPAILATVLCLLAWSDRAGTSAPVDAVLALLAAGAAYETAVMLGKAGARPSIATVVLFSAALGGIGLFAPHDPATRGVVRSFLLVGAVAAAFLPHLRAPRAGDLESLLATVFPVVFVGALFGLLREVGDGPLGARSIAFVVVASKASDIGGWVVGKSIGRHKMIPSVSPGKTWEGTFGGLAFSVGAAVGMGAVFGGQVPLGASAARAAGVGLALGAASTFAGLAHSALKRRCGVKDSSALLPEMGGLLDMIDSLLFAGPVAWGLSLAFA